MDRDLLKKVEAAAITSVGVNLAALRGQSARGAGADVVYLDLPPSVNNLFLTTKTGKRVKVPEYRAWLAYAAPLLAALGRPTRLPCAVTVDVIGRLRGTRDLDNMLKPIGDALVAAGVLGDDNRSFVGRWVIEHIPTDADPCVAVSVGPIPPRGK